MMALKCLPLSVLVLLISTSGFIDAVPSGYTYINYTHAYYKLHTEEVTWAVAVSTCQSEDARLFHPDSAEELELVWRELNVGNNGGSFINTGFSDKDRRNEYKTVDGRPISQVYNKWGSGEPDSNGGKWHCGGLYPYNHLLYVLNCDNAKRFICKHEETVTATDMATVTAAVELLKREVASMHLQAANQSAAMDLLKQEAASMHLQAANQSAAIDLLKQEVASMKFHDANQTRALERIAEADANQAASLDRLVENLQRHAANQTAAVERQALAMERQALAMERFAGPQEQ